jgi:hypothetical protein
LDGVRGDGRLDLRIVRDTFGGTRMKRLKTILFLIGGNATGAIL